MNNPLDRKPYINPRATKHLRVRLLPDIRQAIEDEAAALKTSMTNVTLSSLALYFAKHGSQSYGGNWLDW